MKIASEGKLGKIWSVGVCVYGEKRGHGEVSKKTMQKTTTKAKERP